MYGFGGRKPLIIVVTNRDWTVFRTCAACGTFFLIHITGMATNECRELAHLSLNGNQFRFCDDLNVGGPTGLNQFRCENSHGTIIGGERLIQLSHGSSDRGTSFHEIDIVAQIGKIQGGLNSGNSAANDHHGPDNIVIFASLIHMKTYRD
jgi:hypothetical protein